MNTKKKILLVISLVLMFGFKYFPPVMGLNPTGMATLGITVGTIILLIGVNLIWPAFLCMLAFAVNGVYTLNQAIAGTLGGSIFWFMLINAMVIGATEKTGLLRRVALWLVCRPIAKKSPWAFLGIFVLAELICGSLMNTTAVCLLFLALAKEIMDAVHVEKGSKFGATMMVIGAAMANVSHAITPFGHSNTILSINYFADLGTPDFGQYCVIGYIAMVLGLIVTLLAMKFYSKMDVSTISGFDPSVLLANQQPMSVAEKIAAGILIFIQSGAVTGFNTMGLAIVLAITCQAALATPPAGAPAGILAGQGWVSSGQQFKDGFVYNILWWLVALAAYFLTGLFF